MPSTTAPCLTPTVRLVRIAFHSPGAGHEGYVGAEADRDPLFDNGRMMAAIVLRKPRFFTGSREKKRLVPADLEDMERLGKKVCSSCGAVW